MGARNGGNPHAACDVEGAGDVVWVGTPGPHRRASPRPYCAADGGQRKSNRARLLRPDTCEATEQREATPGGSRGGKGLTQGEQPLGGRGSDTEPICRVDPNDGCASGERETISFIARRLTRGRSPVR